MKHWWQFIKSGLGLNHVDNLSVQEIEARLLAADCGTALTATLITAWTQELKKIPEHNDTKLREALHTVLKKFLEHPVPPLQKGDCISLWGVNGVGKTTTAAKIAYHLQQQGYSVILGACDTFRAAASEQLDVWAQDIGCSIVKQQPPADSASVAFDTLQAQKSRGVDFSILDTAGRMHHNLSLQQQSQKIIRVLKKIHVEAPQHRLLVLDAHSGQNSLSQAQHFHEAIQLTGLVVTKWDGGAKGGFLAHIAYNLALPIYFISSGEDIASLETFDLEKYIERILT